MATHDKTIDLDRIGAPLADVLQELSRETGQPLAAARDVAWDEVCLHVKDRPGDQALDDLAFLMDYTWNEDQGGKLLFQGARARALQDSRRREWHAAASALLLDWASLAGRPASYYARLKESPPEKRPDDPRLQGVELDSLADPARHAGRALLLTLSKDEIVDLIAASDRNYYMAWSDMSGPQRELALRVADGLASDKPGYARSKRLPGARRWVQEVGLVLQLWLWPHTTYPHIYQVFVCDSGLTIGMLITQRPRAPAPAAVRRNPYEDTRTRSGRSEEDSSAYHDLDRIPFPVRGFRQQYPLAWSSIFSQLAARLDLALYSDHFAGDSVGVNPAFLAAASEGPEHPRPVPLEKLSVGRALDSLGARFHRSWWWRGKALFFRSQTWFRDWLAEIARPLLAELQAELGLRGRLSTKGFDILAGFTWEQLGGLNRLAGEAFGARLPRQGSARGIYWLLRAYSALDPDGRATALSRSGLAAARMSDEERATFRTALFVCAAPPILPEDPPPLRFEQSVVRGTSRQGTCLGQVAVSLAGGGVTGGDGPGGFSCIYVPFSADGGDHNNEKGDGNGPMG